MGGLISITGNLEPFLRHPKPYRKFPSLPRGGAPWSPGGEPIYFFFPSGHTKLFSTCHSARSIGSADRKVQLDNNRNPSILWVGQFWSGYCPPMAWESPEFIGPASTIAHHSATAGFLFWVVRESFLGHLKAHRQSFIPPAGRCPLESMRRAHLFLFFPPDTSNSSSHVTALDQLVQANRSVQLDNNRIPSILWVGWLWSGYCPPMACKSPEIWNHFSGI
jgi:hypothetical protein